MIRKSDTKDGLKVRIEARVGDSSSGDIHHGWNTVTIIEPTVHIDFIGPQDKIIDPELSFTTMV